MLTRNRACRILLPLLFWLAIWQGAAAAIDQALLLPGPWTVAMRLWALAQTGEFWRSALFSLLRIGAGYLLALAIGTGLAVLTTTSSLADVLLAPLLRAIKTIPVVSFIVLALLWLAKGLIPLVISFLMVLPLVWANMCQGLRQTDPDLLEMGRCFGLSPGALLWRLKLPAARPYFTSAAETGLGFAWKSGVAAEVLATPAAAIGTNLIQAKLYLETPDLFAWTLLLVALSLSLEKGCHLLLANTQRRR